MLPIKKHYFRSFVLGVFVPSTLLLIVATTTIAARSTLDHLAALSLPSTRTLLSPTTTTPTLDTNLLLAPQTTTAPTQTTTTDTATAPTTTTTAPTNNQDPTGAGTSTAPTTATDPLPTEPAPTTMPTLPPEFVTPTILPTQQPSTTTTVTPPPTAPPAAPTTTPPAPVAPPKKTAPAAPKPTSQPIVPAPIAAESESVLPAVIEPVVDESAVSSLSLVEAASWVQQGTIDNPQVEKWNDLLALPLIGLLLLANLLLMYGAVFEMCGVGSAFFHYLYSLLSQPLSALAKRKGVQWGNVFDSVTNRPVDLAIIRLMNAHTKQLVATRVTDNQGRFLLIAEPGNYTMQLARKDFLFPSTILADKSTTGAGGKMYTGSVIAVTEQAPLSYTIPVDPNRQVQPIDQEVAMHKKKLFKAAFTGIGPVVALISFIISPSIIVGSLFGVQVLTWAGFKKLTGRHPLRNWGLVQQQGTKASLFQTVVRVFDTTYNKLLETQVTDRRGRYGFLVTPNTYQVTAEKVGFEKYTSKPITIKNEQGGIIKEPIVLRGK